MWKHRSVSSSSLITALVVFSFVFNFPAIFSSSWPSCSWTQAFHSLSLSFAKSDNEIACERRLNILTFHLASFTAFKWDEIFVFAEGREINRKDSNTGKPSSIWQQELDASKKFASCRWVVVYLLLFWKIIEAVIVVDFILNNSIVGWVECCFRKEE